MPDRQSFTLQCPECRSRFEAKPELSGKTLPCPKCGSSIQVPDAKQSPWFVETSDGRVLGPLVKTRIDALVEDDQLSPASRIRRGDWEHWQPIGNVYATLATKETTEEAAREPSEEPPGKESVADRDATMSQESPSAADNGEVLEALMRCPFCGEKILSSAVKCRWCHEFIRRKPPRNRLYTTTAYAVAMVVLLIAAIVGYRIVAGPNVPEEPDRTGLQGNVFANAPRKLTDLIAEIEPAVVQINASGPEGEWEASGFVVDRNGTIVTNHHVISEATQAVAVFQNGAKVPVAGWLAIEPNKDIAVLKVDCDPSQLQPLRIAETDPQKGEGVAAFGSPLGFSQSVSDGIVSAIRQAKDNKFFEAYGFQGTWVQTTAPISHGNSGGPLVNAAGEVVGMNTLTLDELGENINFAVAASELRDTIARAAKHTPKPLRPTPTAKRVMPKLETAPDDALRRRLLRVMDRVVVHVETMSEEGVALGDRVPGVAAQTASGILRAANVRITTDVSLDTAFLGIAILSHNASPLRASSSIEVGVQVVVLQKDDASDDELRIVQTYRQRLFEEVDRADADAAAVRQVATCVRKLVQARDEANR